MLVSADGVAKLSGFDCSTVFEDALPLPQPTEPGPKSLRWMVRFIHQEILCYLTLFQAPELLHKREANGPRVMRSKPTDVYALGMVSQLTHRRCSILTSIFTDDAGTFHVCSG